MPWFHVTSFSILDTFSFQSLPFLHTVDFCPAIFTFSLCYIYICIALRAFYYLDSWIQFHNSVISAKRQGILLIFGSDFPISQVHQSDLQLHSHAQPAVFFVFLQVRIVNHVVIYDIRSGIVASAGFIVQIIIESPFVDPGTTPEFSLSSVFPLFASSDELQYRISIPQIACFFLTLP